MIFSVNSSVRTAWNLVDYVPLASSAKSLYMIFQKYAFSGSLDLRRTIYQYDYLERDSWSRQFTLLVPFVGNFVVLLYDLFFAHERLELATTSNITFKSSSSTPSFRSFDTIQKSMRSFRAPQKRTWCARLFSCFKRQEPCVSPYNDGVDSDISGSEGDF